MAATSSAAQKIPEPDFSNQDGWAGVIDTLYNEHGYILSLLKALDKQAALLEPGKIPDYALLLEMVDYLLNYPDEYHHPREDLVFNGVRRRDPTFKTRFERLQREHKTLHSYNDKLFRQLSDVVSGRPADKPELRRALQNYTKAYRQHIRFESNEIFPHAKGTLSEADLRRIDTKTRYGDDPLFGKRARSQYKRLGRKLQIRIADLEEQFLVQEFSALESVIERLSDAASSLTDIEDHLNRFGLDRLRENGCAGLMGKSGTPGRPSWQARVMNTFTRTLMKPMMRFGSVESMRSMTGRFEEAQEQNLPDDIRSKKVKKEGYEGVWINIAGKRPRKVILYFPGGGFVMRTAVQHKGFVAKICRAANTKALLVHYRLAPEIPFPGGLEDCLAAYHDLLDQGIRPTDITIAGDSAGGGLVLSTLLALRDEGSPMPANAIILSPLGDLTYTGESRKFNKYRDPMLPTHRASQMHQIYIGDSLPEDRYISPVFADFDGLPPILGQVGSTEILLDDTVRAAERAREANVPFFLEVWNELPHVFPIFGMLPEAAIAIERMGEFINNSELDEIPARYGRSQGRREKRPNASGKKARRQ
jgi:acetyl esterase/lipase/hemerythrin-like domain-containing protein